MKLEIRRNNIRTAIIDDDMGLIDELSEYVYLTNGLELAYSSANPVRALKDMPNLELDLIFLDMEMPVLDGMKFMAQMKKMIYDTQQEAGIQIVVCSAHEHFAVKTYDYQVTDYLTKPFTFERYMQAVDEVKSRLLRPGLNRLSRDNTCLMVCSHRGTVIRRLAFADILYLEAREDKTWLWIGQDQYYEVDEVFKHVLNRLPKELFVRIHRSYAIGVRHFGSIKGKHIVRLADMDVHIPIGDKSIYHTFTNWLSENAISGRHHHIDIDKSKL